MIIGDRYIFQTCTNENNIKIKNTCINLNIIKKDRTVIVVGLYLYILVL